MSKTVNEKVKDGTLLNTVQSSVVNVSSKVGNVSKKAWQDMSTILTNPNYDSISGRNESTNFNESSSIAHSSSSSKTKQQTNNDWNWDDSSWETNEDKNKGNTSKANLVNLDSSASEWTAEENDLWESIDSKKN